MSYRGGGGFGGRGRGRGGGRRGGGRGLGPSGICKCMKCGREVPHKPGIPCNQTICPECHIPMMRAALNQNSSRNLQFPIQNQGTNQIYSTYMQNNIQQIIPPVVDKEKCTGCAECVNQCPNDAISLVDNKAMINPTQCRNCRICEDVCPVNAIH